MDEQKRPRAWVYARIPGDYDLSLIHISEPTRRS